ncbi:hypothetical protein DHL47_09815 [Streptococcus panodentis]|uniref:Uncharacterized protein n=1 Tax=Streptococcus panodentis TaxID=1581472 RepID=A0ABS5AYK1_9STRE|nr:hypothetical protein [Streptococcus panodentis]
MQLLPKLFQLHTEQPVAQYAAVHLQAHKRKKAAAALQKQATLTLSPLPTARKSLKEAETGSHDGCALTHRGMHLLEDTL